MSPSGVEDWLLPGIAAGATDDDDAERARVIERVVQGRQAIAAKRQQLLVQLQMLGEDVPAHAASVSSAFTALGAVATANEDDMNKFAQLTKRMQVWQSLASSTRTFPRDRGLSTLWRRR